MPLIKPRLLLIRCSDNEALDQLHNHQTQSAIALLENEYVVCAEIAKPGCSKRILKSKHHESAFREDVIALLRIKKPHVIAVLHHHNCLAYADTVDKPTVYQREFHEKELVEMRSFLLKTINSLSSLKHYSKDSVLLYYFDAAYTLQSVGEGVKQSSHL